MSTEERIIELIEGIREDTNEMKITLAINTQSLEEHVKRTNILQEKVEQLDKDVTKLRGFFSILGWIVGVCATALTILDKLGKI